MKHHERTRGWPELNASNVHRSANYAIDVDETNQHSHVITMDITNHEASDEPSPDWEQRPWRSIGGT